MQGDKRQQTTPDEKADLFVQLTDDLSYARTFYPQSRITTYLNGLTAGVHRAIYQNKREEGNRIWRFWATELPQVLYESRRQLWYSLLIFVSATAMGVLSSAHDSAFANLVLGDGYINMTLENIENGDPMGVYKDADSSYMFTYITFNNIRVSFLAFVAGVFLSLGTVYLLFSNGVMLGVFQYFFYERGLLLPSFLTIWIHGTLEISAIVIAGGAGLVMGNSILFPGTYSRSDSFMMGARKGLKIVLGLVPIFITAGFLESYVTRLTEMSTLGKLTIIGSSATFIVGYFVLYPMWLHRRGLAVGATEQ